MELHHIILIAVAAANLAVTIWLLRLLIPMWRKLKKVMGEVDKFDFDKLAKEFLGDKTPLAESVNIKVSENKEEDYKEITVVRSFKRPLDPKEVQEGVVRQMAKELQ
jgi:hypothetical protein